VSEEKLSTQSLSSKGIADIKILSPASARPAGCIVFPVSSAVSVYIYVRDRVDFDKEIAKATKKLENTYAAV
jgi:valyl-tRNA synthetase